MAVFQYSEEEELYLAVVDGVEFVSEEEPELSEEEVGKLARSYQENLPRILGFMIPALERFYGALDKAGLPKALGRPRIDLDTSEVTYCEHTLDETHVFGFEFYDNFETLENFTIDG